MRDLIEIMEGFFSSDEDCWLDDKGARHDLDRASRETHAKYIARAMGDQSGNAIKKACDLGWLRVWVEGQICFLECNFARVSRHALKAAITVLDKAYAVSSVMIEDSASTQYEKFDDIKKAQRKLRELSVKRDLSMMFEDAKIEETYTDQNVHLNRYLASTEFDGYSFWYISDEWASRNDEEEIEEALGEPLDSEEPEQYEKLTPELKSDFEEFVTSYLERHSPAELPSSHYFSFSKMIKRQTWLVHFSDNADQVVSSGFTHGIYDVDRLGLTTYFSHDSKKYGGYNFAFEAGSRDSRIAASRGKYGRDFVIFQNAGVKAYHSSDEEDQVIFWGPDVDKRNLILVRKIDGDFHVVSRKGETLMKGDFEPVVEWVMKHHRQYSRQLYGY